MKTNGQKQACIIEGKVIEVPCGLLILVSRRTCSFYSILIAVPDLKPRKTIVYEVNSLR
jgi:hypothetical protein